MKELGRCCLPYYLETNMPGVFAARDVRRCSIGACLGDGEGPVAVTSFLDILGLSLVSRG